MQFPKRVEFAARARVDKARTQIQESLKQVRMGCPLAAEKDTERLLARLQTKAQLSREEAGAIAAGIKGFAATPDKERREALAKVGGPEQIWGKTIDFVGVAFLERGRLAARSVARVATLDGRPIGSGFMVSKRLFLTNNHVIGSAEEASGLVVEFDYELDQRDLRRDPSRFRFDSTAFFLTDDRDDLDFTLVAVGSRESGQLDLQEFGCCALSDAGDKHALGEVANIVQHPDGRYKEVVLRENRLVSRLPTVLHYVADTEPGSSGSPVFNNEWRAIALHHWGGPWRQKKDDGGKPLPTEVNEGIRVSAIVARLRTLEPRLDASRRALLRGCLRHEETSTPVRSDDGNGASLETRIDSRGRVTWRVPLEISVCLPMLEAGARPTVGAPVPAPTPDGTLDARAERKLDFDPNYANRAGYDPDFISGFEVPLPKISEKQRKLAARNREAKSGDDPFELEYEHFSVVLNKRRKLAFFTACNIDGKTAKNIDRKTGKISANRPGEDEALDEAAEASETWIEDDRIDPKDGTNQDLYNEQTVDGFPDRRKQGFRDRMFQRGHLVRRQDPIWGTEKRARKAEADTFHFTNCTPQVGFFNMGTYRGNEPGTGNGQLWRALEDYVLDNAVEERKRVCVFTGPVLDDKDPKWRDDVIDGFRVPMRFWKIVAWSGEGRLDALAMLADQRKVLKVMPELLDGAEEYDDTAKVEDFLSTVAEIERVTGLDFGKVLRAADIRKGESLSEGRGKRQTVPVTSFEEIPLGPVSESVIVPQRSRRPAASTAKRRVRRRARAKK